MPARPRCSCSRRQPLRTNDVRCSSVAAPQSPALQHQRNRWAQPLVQGSSSVTIRSRPAWARCLPITWQRPGSWSLARAQAASAPGPSGFSFLREPDRKTQAGFENRKKGTAFVPL